MSCAPLASTGVAVLSLIALGAAVLVVGAVLVLLARGRRARTATAAIVLVLISGGLTIDFTWSSPAQAGAPSCAASVNPGASANPDPGLSASPRAIPSAQNSLTIVQTSTMAGLAPGIAAVAITGTVTNRSPTSTLVTAVTVSIAAVTESLGGTAGTCDESDYILLDPTMPVAQTLAPSESAAFSGARIGFRNKTINQDACQGAVITLYYVSS